MRSWNIKPYDGSGDYLMVNPKWRRPKRFETYKQMRAFYVNLPLDELMTCHWDYVPLNDKQK